MLKIKLASKEHYQADISNIRLWLLKLQAEDPKRGKFR